MRTHHEPAFDEYAASYPRLLEDPLRDRFAADPVFFHQRKWLLIRDFLRRRRLDPGKLSWLDAGCGRGDLLRLAGPEFREAMGCDPSPEMIRSAGAQVYLQPSPCELPFSGNSFDFVTAVCVYHHVHGIDRRRLLTQSIGRVLRPGGLLCLIEHNPYNPVTRRIVRRCVVDRDAELLTARSAAALARSAGLEIIGTDYFLYFPEPLFRLARGLEDLLRKLPLGGQYALLGRKPAPH
jgi:SAM-dependent methyltransferase